MQIAFLSSPYRSPTINGVAENVASARAAAVKLWSLGYGVFCPALNSAFMDGVVDDQRFMDFAIVVMPFCRLVVFNGDWQNSDGCWKEHLVAHSIPGMKIYSMDDVPPAKEPV